MAGLAVPLCIYDKERSNPFANKTAAMRHTK
jgi:hypothetical protein